MKTVSTLQGNIRPKRIYDEPSPDDGRRILITRYWPRGVRQDAAILRVGLGRPFQDGDRPAMCYLQVNHAFPIPPRAKHFV